jgi:hypothetical protein
MSDSHRRLFEASLAALLLADCDEKELPGTAQARDQWHKSMVRRTLRAEPWERPSAKPTA